MEECPDFTRDHHETRHLKLESALHAASPSYTDRSQVPAAAGFFLSINFTALRCIA
jgi:hypothetical protein